MKKHFTLFIATITCLVLVFSSCSQQVYSYRSKVKVKQGSDEVKKESENAIEISAKPFIAKETAVSMAAPTEGLVQPEVVKENRQTTKSLKRAHKIASVIEKMVPSKTGLAAVNGIHSKKALAKATDVKEVAVQGIDAKKWMIVGLIIMLGAIVLGLLTGYTFFYGIGALIFVIGLVFYLMEMLL